MTKKNSTQPSGHGDHSVLWWVGWIVLTIVTFFISCAFWTPFIARHVGGMDSPAAPALWVTAVFGSWMVLLVPLIVVMYNKVDRAYEDARIRRETAALEKKIQFSPVQSAFIPENKRLLNESLVRKIKKMPQTVKRGHLVDVRLNDGKKIEHVFVLDKKEVVGVYGYEKPPFRVSQIVDVLPTDLDRLPVFETGKWLRFDLEEKTASS